MRTEELARRLAASASPVRPRAASTRLAVAALAALPVAGALLLVIWRLRPDLDTAWQLPLFWVKLLLPLALALGGAWVVQRLARPGVEVGWRVAGVVAPVAFLWALGIATWASNPEADREALLFGATWRHCPVSILLLSLPTLAAGLFALRRLAPTRLRLAGAAVGAMAGGSGAAVYALHCPEMSPVFLAVWYVLGMALPVLLGASLGRWLLRW